MCYVLQLLGSNGIDLPEKVIDVAFLIIMQETLGKIEGKLFAVITGNGYLPFYLSLGSLQLSVGKRMLLESIKFTIHQLPTATDIVMVATEIDRPTTYITITGHSTLDGINQSMTFAQGEIKTRIHAGTSQNIIE